MFGDPEAWHKATTAMTWIASVEWLDLAETWESRAEKSFDLEEIRYAAESARLARAIAAWRQMYAEVTS